MTTNGCYNSVIISMKQSHRKCLEDFIKLYEENFCLWDMKSKEYHNRSKRSDAYTVLVDKYSEIEPNCTREDVCKKINNLRSNLRKEKRKLQESMKTAKSTKDIYTPSLWYYHLFDFLDSQGTKDTTSKMDMDIEELTFIEVPDEEESDFEQQEENDNDIDDEDEDDDPIAMVASVSTKHIPKSRASKRKFEPNHSIDDLHEIRNHFKRNPLHEDQFDIMGKHLALKLRSLDTMQRIFAEKMINDVVYNAELGYLNESTSLNVSKNANTYSRNQNSHNSIKLSYRSSSPVSIHSDNQSPTSKESRE